MEPSGSGVYFFQTASPEEIRREKEKAKVLRKTQWWQRQIARGICHYCQKQIPPKELTMDHIVPLVRGGASTRGNVVPACKTCNNKKKYLLPIEWQEYIGSLSKDGFGKGTLNATEPKEDRDE
jgi:5-methylcytosine-specific restriction enzyme A